MKPRLIIEMIRRVWLILLILLTGAQLASAGSAPPLYHQVAGGRTEVVVTKGDTLAHLALVKGVRWWVVAWHNHLKKPYKLKPGTIIKINNTHIVPAVLKDGLVINLPELNLYWFKNGVYQRRYPLAVGKPSWPTPTGSYKICNKSRNPTWNVPASIQEEMEETGHQVLEKVPPGPKNPLGKFWMGTSAPGVGIHATNHPWTVGYSVSHGCIRMLPKEIAGLFPQVEVGTPVKIIYQPLKLALTPSGHVYLEANRNIYHWVLHSLAWVKGMAAYYHIQDRIDWRKVRTILKIREGVAHDITKESVVPVLATPKQVRLSPLHGKKTKLE
jgi:L,D-transpeptidase ErfK/SrfK